MTDIHDMRARLRQTAHQPASSGGGGGVPFWVVAAGAVALGFAVVLFAPRFYSVQRTAALPGFQEMARHVDSGPKGQDLAPAGETPALGNAARYAGNGADEAARIADDVCEQHVRAARAGGPASRPGGLSQNGGLTADNIPHENEKLHCFLTEGLPRFCAAGQARRATADVINYFKGIEYANAAMAIASKLSASAPAAAFMPSVADAASSGKLAPDPRVIVAVEGLMRAGYLTRSEREEIGANMTPPIRERFARVIGNASPCPKPPWWAIWK